MKKVLVLGATSAVARTMAAELAARGEVLYFAGRDTFELERLAADFRIRYQVEAHCGQVEAEDFAQHSSFIQSVVETLGRLDGVILTIGYLGQQPEESHDPESARRIAQVNFTAAVSLLAPVANILKEQGHGFIAALSSVAGDRGRQSNYVYGAAKGGLSLYLQGLRNRLDRHGVKVFTLKLGFVDTAMTYGKEGMFLVASPDKVGKLAIRTLQKDAGIYYIPRFWGIIMPIVRLIPEFLFKRLNL